jgi:hypothetical protein
VDCPHDSRVCARRGVRAPRTSAWTTVISSQSSLVPRWRATQRPTGPARPPGQSSAAPFRHVPHRGSGHGERRGDRGPAGGTCPGTRGVLPTPSPPLPFLAEQLKPSPGTPYQRSGEHPRTPQKTGLEAAPGRVPPFPEHRPPHVLSDYRCGVPVGRPRRCRCRWCASAFHRHSNYRMTDVAEYRVSRPAPPGAAEGACRPGWDRMGTAVATRSDRTLMSTLGSSATTRKLSRHTRPAEVRPDMPGTGVEQSTGQRENR